jgi:hypothetical protein
VGVGQGLLRLGMLGLQGRIAAGGPEFLLGRLRSPLLVADLLQPSMQGNGNFGVMGVGVVEGFVGRIDLGLDLLPLGRPGRQLLALVVQLAIAKEIAFCRDACGKAPTRESFTESSEKMRLRHSTAEAASCRLQQRGGTPRLGR